MSMSSSAASPIDRRPCTRMSSCSLGECAPHHPLCPHRAGPPLVSQKAPFWEVGAWSWRPRSSRAQQSYLLPGPVRGSAHSRPRRGTALRQCERTRVESGHSFPDPDRPLGSLGRLPCCSLGACHGGCPDV